MTPTWSLLLLVFVFWTYPATAAVIAYRLHGSSMENVTSAFWTSVNDLSNALSFDTLTLGPLTLESLNRPVQSEA
jgi:hypothetical protein